MVCRCLACSNKHCLNLLIFKQSKKGKQNVPEPREKQAKLVELAWTWCKEKTDISMQIGAAKLPLGTMIHDVLPPCPSYPSYPSWNGQPKIEVDNDDLSVLTCFNNVIVTYHQAPDKKCQLWTALRASTVFNISEKVTSNHCCVRLKQRVVSRCGCGSLMCRLLQLDFRYAVAAGAGHFIEYFEGAAQALRSHNNDIL